MAHDVVERQPEVWVRPTQPSTIETISSQSLSPFLFCRYIRDLLHDIAQAGIGCNIGGVFINILAHANDIVLLAPSWRAMQDLGLLVILESHTVKIDKKCNESKTVCMVFQPKRHSHS